MKSYASSLTLQDTQIEIIILCHLAFVERKYTILESDQRTLYFITEL